MLIHNPTNKLIEFRWGGKPYYVVPGETVVYPKHLGKHVTEFTNTGLVEIEEKKNVDYSTMPWRRLVSAASYMGVFKPGISRKKIEEMMVQHDEQERRALQESINKEEEDRS